MNRNSVTRALIIAAGRGIRLNEHSQEIPKCLISVGERSIIEMILSTLQQAGIEEVIIVTGYKREAIEQRLGDGHRFGLTIKYVFNNDWQKNNGVSVYAARHYFKPYEPFLLMMSDHLFEPEMLATVMSAPLETGEIVLAVDRRVDSVFDINDATKVIFDGHNIEKIGKMIKNFNGIDCGLFKCTTDLFNALQNALVDGDCSLSDACSELIRLGKMRGVDIGNRFWIDIDTPEALAFAIENIST